MTWHGKGSVMHSQGVFPSWLPLLDFCQCPRALYVLLNWHKGHGNNDNNNRNTCLHGAQRDELAGYVCRPECPCIGWPSKPMQWCIPPTGITMGPR